MGLSSLEEFDKEMAAKRERLLKQHALVHKLPTKGVMVRWTGEGGWESDGNTRKPDVERSVELVPHIVHSPFRGAQHVAFCAPDSFKDIGEHVSSLHRDKFVRLYLASLLDACAPHMIDTLAIRGHYSSLVPETFDYTSHRDYKDAEEISRGLYEVEAAAGNGYTSASLCFYIKTEETGSVKVSFDLRGFNYSKLLPRGRRTSDTERSNIISWTVPNNTGACQLFRRAGADTRNGVPQSYTVEYLFDAREAMEAMIL